MTFPAVPVWAVQRVNAVLARDDFSGGAQAGTAELARRTGLSKRLVRRCLFYTRSAEEPGSSVPQPAISTTNC
jgi:hypothetical protein